jgi:hypothetical protein
VRELIATQGHEFSQFVVALAEIDTVDLDTAAHAVDDRVGALEAISLRLRRSVTPASRQPRTGWRSTTC